MIFIFSIEKSWSHSKHNLQEYESAQHDHSCEDCQHPHEAKKITDEEVRAIAQLTRLLHHAIEGEHIHAHSVKGFFQTFRNKEQWARLLNFHRMAKRTTRAFNLESNKDHLKNHAKNLALLFPLSHFIEVATAPTFIAIGTIHGLPSIVVGSGGSLLSLIAIPGLDPLCILLMSTYPLKPVHRSVDFIRRAVERGLRGIITTVKLDVLLSKTYSYEDRFSFIQQKLQSDAQLNQLFTVEVNTFEGGSRLSLFDGTGESEILSLRRIWDAEENRFYIKSILISQHASPDILRRGFFKLLSWNARAALREVLELRRNPERASSYEKEFFVEQVIADKRGVRVTYKDRAIYLRDRIQLRNVLRPFRQSCKDSLVGIK